MGEPADVPGRERTTDQTLARSAGTALGWRAGHLAVASLVSSVGLIVLARFLTPGDFGLLAIAALVVGSTQTLTDIGMVPALVQRPQPTAREYDVAWTVTLLRSAVVSLALLLAAAPLAGVFGAPEATPVLRVLALRPLVESGASIRLAELIREFRFRRLAALGVAGSVLETVVAIALAPALGVWALVIGALTGAATRATGSYVVAPYRPTLVLDAETARPLIRFGRWIFLTGVFAVAGNFVLQAVISRRLGPAELGLYYLAVKLAFLPSEAANRIFGEVTFPLFARVQDDLAARARSLRAVAAGLFAAFLPVFALLIALAPSVPLLLGERWAGAAPVIRVLAVAGAVGLLGDAAVPWLKGTGRPYLVTALELVQSLALMGLVWWLAGAFGLAGAASAWIAAAAVSGVLGVVFLRRLLGAGGLGALAPPLLATAAAAGGGASIAAVVQASWPGLAGLLAAVGVGLAAHALLLALFDRMLGLRLRSEFLRAVPRAAALDAWALGWLGPPNGPASSA